MEEEADRMFEERALPHLVQSLGALQCIVQAALSGGRSIEELDVARVQQQVEVASKEVELSVGQAQEVCEQLDAACEKATAQHGQLSQQCREQAAALQDLQTKVQQLESEREAANNRLQVATVSFRQAEDTLRSARAKVGEKQTGRDVGIGLSFLLPCVGIPMAVAFEKERQLSKCQEAVASDDRSQLRADISKEEKLLAHVGAQLPELQTQARGLEQQLQDGRTAEEQLQGQRRELAQRQERLRTSCHALTSLQGKLAALKAQSRHLYSMGPLLPFLEEAILQSLLLPPQPPFTQPGVQRVLGDLKVLLPRVKELHLSQDTSDYLK
ncbi:myosin-10-like [Pristis pectinata]|uniref:myosin-10-like n=1 Tax=Pristis pectinata TaxID=685728 RepID=UPI00223D6FE0|nr:myosin-10-like [Pristis pectinata]